MNNTPAVQDPIKSLLANNIKAVTSVLPKHLTPERIMRIALTAINKVPKLRECTQASILNCVVEASQLGLEVGGPLDHAHLIPFKLKNSGMVCQLLIGYQGYIELAYRSPRVSHISAHPVHAGDKFVYQYGTQPTISHAPLQGAMGVVVVPKESTNSKDVDKAARELIAAYAVVHYTNGNVDFEVVDKRVAEISKKRSSAGIKKDSPWNQPDLVHTMWMKTAIRTLRKRIPQSPELQRAAQIESALESGVVTDLGHLIDAAGNKVDIAEPPKNNANAALTNKIQKASDISPPVEITEEMIEAEIDGENKELMLQSMKNFSFNNIPRSKKDRVKLWNEYQKRLPTE